MHWTKSLQKELEQQRREKNIYLKALTFAVGTLFDTGHADKGKEAMRMAGLPLETRKEG